MMKCEFEQMVGKEVEYETFRMYEDMYNALPESITKQQFVAMLNIDAIPESEYARQRREERKSFVEKINKDIERYNSWIKEAKSDIKRYYEYIKDSYDEADINFWKGEIKRQEESIKRYRRYIQEDRAIIL